MAAVRDGSGNVAYQRHAPGQTLLYGLIETHYSDFVEQLARQGKTLPDRVHHEFEASLK